MPAVASTTVVTIFLFLDRQLRLKVVMSLQPLFVDDIKAVLTGFFLRFPVVACKRKRSQCPEALMSYK